MTDEKKILITNAISIDGFAIRDLGRTFKTITDGTMSRDEETVAVYDHMRKEALESGADAVVGLTVLSHVKGQTIYGAGLAKLEPLPTP